MIRLLTAAISALVGALAVGILFMLAGLPHTPIGWVWSVLILVIGAFVARVCLSLGLNSSTAFEQGAREAASQSRGASYEATGRRAGAVVGKGLNRVARIGAPRPAPKPAPESTPATPPTASSTASAREPDAPATNAAESSPPTPEITVDKAARVIGSMVGRRAALRRKRS